MSAEDQPAGLDSFTRRYLAILGGIVLLGVAWWLASGDSRVDELNELLRTDRELADYPYTFRVLALENGVASVSSPRSSQLSAVQGLRVMYPELREVSIQSDSMMAAQEQLGQVQSRAARIVSSEADVQRVHWVLDERWLATHGIYIQ